MKDENQLPNITCSFEDVFSAWTVGVVCILCLLVVSMLLEPSPDNTVRAQQGYVDDLAAK